MTRQDVKALRFGNMIGYHHSDGYRVEPMDNRDKDDPEYRIDPVLSSPDFQFSEEDPAKVSREPTATFEESQV